MEGTIPRFDDGSRAELFRQPSRSPTGKTKARKGSSVEVFTALNRAPTRFSSLLRPGHFPLLEHARERCMERSARPFCKVGVYWHFIHSCTRGFMTPARVTRRNEMKKKRGPTGRPASRCLQWSKKQRPVDAFVSRSVRSRPRRPGPGRRKPDRSAYRRRPPRSSHPSAALRGHGNAGSCRACRCRTGARR